MNATNVGTEYSPATSGERPATSWKYWVTTSIVPMKAKKLRVLAASAVLSAGVRSSRRSSNGSDRTRCLRTKMTPMPTPTSTETVAPTLTPA
jgi:hypothetical protein